MPPLSFSSSRWAPQIPWQQSFSFPLQSCHPSRLLAVLASSAFTSPPPLPTLTWESPNPHCPFPHFLEFFSPSLLSPCHCSAHVTGPFFPFSLPASSLNFLSPVFSPCHSSQVPNKTSPSSPGRGSWETALGLQTDGGSRRAESRWKMCPAEGRGKLAYGQ